MSNANISNVINVSLVPEGQLAADDNMNVCAIITSDVGFLDTAKRFALYSDPASVATDFGTDSAAYTHALTFFSQTPNPINAGGLLVIGHWRAAQENVDAIAGILTGAEVEEAVIIPLLQAISDGSFDIDIDGVTESLAALDFRIVTDFSDILTVLNAGLTAATATEVDGQIIIASNTTGATSTVTLPVAGASGTFVGNILGLAAGTGAATVDGVAAAVLALESKIDAITALKALVNFKGFVFSDSVSAADSALLGAWAQANNALGYEVFSSASNLLIDVTNVVWANKLAGYTNYRMLFSPAGNQKLATGYMARKHVVNFNAENSAITMHLKEIKGVVAESYTQTQITNAKAVGLDIYTTIKNVPNILSSGANDFTDNRYNIIAFIDSQETAGYNHLKQTGFKIPQTTAGVNSLVDALEKDCRAFVRAGVFAPGTWSSSDRFGVEEVFNRAIEKDGFYYLAGLLSDQSQADRSARKSPVIQGAVKNAGAIHSADIIINYNL